MNAKGGIHQGPCIFLTFKMFEFTRSWSRMEQHRAQKMSIIFYSNLVSLTVMFMFTRIAVLLFIKVHILLRLKGLTLRRVHPGRD